MNRTIKLEELNKQYEFVCHEWVQKFCNKQKIDFDGWVSDEIGGIASFACQYFLNLSDIILDIKTKQPKGLILDWQSESVDFNMLKEEKQYISYKSYTMGLRYSNLKLKEDITKSFHFGAKVKFMKKEDLKDKEFCLVGFNDNAFAVIEWDKRGDYSFEYYTGSVYSDLELV